MYLDYGGSTACFQSHINYRKRVRASRRKFDEIDMQYVYGGQIIYWLNAYDPEMYC